jgi:hypothetical protein
MSLSFGALFYWSIWRKHLKIALTPSADLRLVQAGVVLAVQSSSIGQPALTVLAALTTC